MQTNTTTPLVSELNLLRVTVLKKKHAQQIRENINAHPQTQFEDVDILFHITEWDAVLCQRKDNGRFVILGEAVYYNQMLKAAKGPEISGTRERCRAFLHQLPQIFLD